MTWKLYMLDHRYKDILEADRKGSIQVDRREIRKKNFP